MIGEHLQLKDLERLASIPELASERECAPLSALHDHLRRCADCSNLVDIYRSLRRTQSPAGQKGSDDCPADEEWFEFAAGVAFPDRSGALLVHAQNCAHCAATLRNAVDDLDLSTEDSDLASLKSSMPEWQNIMAGHMMQQAIQPAGAPADKNRWQRWLFSKPALAFALSVLIVAGGSIVGIRYYRQTTTDGLFASAYNLQRNTVLHLPGGDSVAVHSPALGASESDDNLPLLKLKERVQEHVAQSPDDPFWQQVSGRVALLEGDGDAARKKLDFAYARNPSLPGLQFDRAAAYFEIGEVKRDSYEYAKAADLFGQVVGDPAAEKQKAIAYFNLALCWERLSIYSEAVDDYQAALKLEKNPAWRAEISNRLAEAERKLLNSEGKGNSYVDTSPAGFLVALENTPDRVDTHYEIYFDHAEREWLTRHDPQSETAVRRLAEIGLRHRDAWLHDAEDSARTHDSQEAFKLLAHGLDANLMGDADDAFQSLTKAGTLFEAAHNEAGALRVRVELIYTLQRLGRSDECLKVADPLSGDSRLRRYGWLYAYEVLESSICNAARGDSRSYLASIQHSLAISTQDRFSIEVLREQGMMIQSLDSAGRSDAAWRATSPQLEACADGAVCTPMRVYQFLHSLYDLVAAKDLHWTAAGIARSATHFADLTPNLQIRGYAQEVLGVAETATGHAEPAAQAFSQATEILKSLPHGHAEVSKNSPHDQAEPLYEADWETDRSILLDRQGDLSAALQSMRKAGAQIATTDNLDIRQRHYAQLADLLLDSGSPVEASKAALKAVDDAEHALTATQNEAGKLTWEKSYGRGYRLLAESLIDMGRNRQSLQAWEWYHSAPYRSEQFSHLAMAERFDAVPVAIDSSRNNIDLVIVVVRLEHYIVVWSVPASPGSSIRLAKLTVSPARLAEMAQTFTELCSDPNSSPKEIGLLGAQLYREIFAPIDDQIRSAAHIALETDSTLEFLPFAALVTADGRYFGDSHTLSRLPAWWTLRRAGPDTIPSASSALVVEGYPTLPSFGSHPADTIPAEYLETEVVAAHFQHTLRLRQREATVSELRLYIPGMEVVHFNGHSSEADGQSGLLLQPNQIFTASDLRGLSLKQCRLIVLAMCSSAGTANLSLEDTSNLTHAMLSAGAANVVATLWDVDAKASKSMVLEMYDALSRSASIPDAVRAAQQKLRANPATRHPFFWSSVQVFTQ